MPLERMFRESNQNAFSEAIRTIRSGVLLSGMDSPRKVVLLTSSMPDEGKTTVASNLAFAFAQVKKTLLIDADMRRPKIGRRARRRRATAGPVGTRGRARRTLGSASIEVAGLATCTCCRPAACRPIRSN